MDRAEATGLSIAVVGHIALLAALTLSLARAADVPPRPPSIEVSFVEDVGLVSAAPDPMMEPPAPSEAPEVGPPEQAAPQPEPLPAPPLPTPAPTPPRIEPTPQPRQEPRRERPQPAPRAAQPRETPAPRRESRASPSQTAERTRGSRLGPDLLKGIGRDPSPSASSDPPARMTGAAAADIASAIARQVQPCADRQVYPGAGAERIVTPIILRLNRDGSLNGRPRVGTQTGIDDENRRYAERVADLAVRSFVECAPLRGLPPELYNVPNGWQNFTMRYRLPG